MMAHIGLESTVSSQGRIVKNIFNCTVLDVNLYSIDACSSPLISIFIISESKIEFITWQLISPEEQLPAIILFNPQALRLFRCKGVTDGQRFSSNLFHLRN